MFETLQGLNGEVYRRRERRLTNCQCKHIQRLNFKNKTRPDQLQSRWRKRDKCQQHEHQSGNESCRNQSKNEEAKFLLIKFEKGWKSRKIKKKRSKNGGKLIKITFLSRAFTDLQFAPIKSNQHTSAMMKIDMQAKENSRKIMETCEIKKTSQNSIQKTFKS
jgi:hypothetical protein